MSKERVLLNEFIDYIHDNKPRGMRELDIEQSQKSSWKYLILKFNNLGEFDTEFIQMVEDFRPGTRFIHDEDPEEDRYTYMVRVPFDDPKVSKHKKRHHHHDARNDASKPNIINFMSGVVLLFGTVMMAALTTTKEDWPWLFLAK